MPFEIHSPDQLPQAFTAFTQAKAEALLVPPDDPEALAHAIATLMNDPDLRIRFGRVSRQIVVADFSSARIGDEIVALYARLLAQAVPSDDRVTSWLVR